MTHFNVLGVPIDMFAELASSMTRLAVKIRQAQGTSGVGDDG
jgi:hypothetical protein